MTQLPVPTLSGPVDNTSVACIACISVSEFSHTRNHLSTVTMQLLSDPADLTLEKAVR